MTDKNNNDKGFNTPWEGMPPLMNELYGLAPNNEKIKKIANKVGKLEDDYFHLKKENEQTFIAQEEIGKIMNALAELGFAIDKAKKDYYK